MSETPTHPPLQGMPLFRTPPTTPHAAHIGSVVALGRYAAENPRRPAPHPRTLTAAPRHTRGSSELDTQVDWRLVRSLRTQAADLLTTSLAQRPDLDEPAQQEQARQMILDLLREHNTDAGRSGQQMFLGPGEQHRLAQAIFDSLYGLGRLQPLVDDPDVENISVIGHDNVHLLYADGHKEVGPPVADSDEELIGDIQFLASRSGTSDREFSRAKPILDMRLAGGERLAATAWVSPRPLLSIRRHRISDIDLPALVETNTLDPLVASFLTAAVRTNRRIVVTGDRGAGKTTLLRALCSAFDVDEAICTIETEYELMLDELPHRHHEVFAMEARPGGSERGPGGHRVGEITVDDLLYRAMRLPVNRLIVGEVRGKEIITMLKAMQAGAGSMSTTHAYSAYAAIDRLVTMAMDDGRVTEEFARRQVASHLDLIVHISAHPTTNFAPPGQGPQRRHVADVLALELGERDGQVARTNVFRPDARGFAQPGTLPTWLDDLADAGFDRDTYLRLSTS